MQELRSLTQCQNGYDAGEILFHQFVTVFRGEVQTVKFLELVNALDSFRRERRLAFKAVQDDSFHEIAQGCIQVFSQCFQDFQGSFLETNPGLHPYNFPGLFSCVHASPRELINGVLYRLFPGAQERLAVAPDILLTCCR